MISLYRSRSKLLRTTTAVVVSCIFVVNPFAAADQIAETCKACLFDGNDPDDCIIYGQIDSEVVEWSLGTNACKDNYQNFISSIDPNTSCQNTNAFVNSIRFGDLSNSASRLGLGVASDGGPFFVEDFESNTSALADSLVIDGVTMDCEGSEGDCFNFMKPYFDDGDGALEKDQVCDKLYNQVRVDRNLEQSTLRIRLCMELKEESAIPVLCSPLGTQVGDLIRADPERDCSGFGFETPLASIPGCETAASIISGDGTDDDDGESNLWDDLLNSLGIGSSAHTASMANVSWWIMLLYLGSIVSTYFIL